MVGVLCALEILLMAGVAERRSAGINPIHMAGSAIGGHVRSCQRIAGLLIVVEGRRRPGRRRMADRADEIKRRRSVKGIVRPSVIILMAGIAIRGRAAVPCAVAILAVQAYMSARQGKVGLIMIKAGVIPGTGGMA